MSQERGLQEAIATVQAWRLLQAKRERLSKLLDPEGWDAVLADHKAGRCEHPQDMRSTLIKAVRTCGVQFSEAMQALEKAVG